MTAPTIWKYELEVTHRQTITMPANARVLHVREQINMLDIVPCIWAEVLPTEAPDAKDEARTFEIVGTGGLVPLDGVYLGTAVCNVYVWHVYEIIPGISGASDE